VDVMAKIFTYYLNLKLKSPSEDAKDVGLKPFAEDAYEAMEHFNARFRGIKSISIMEAKGIGMDLILYYHKIKPEKVTAKELTVFSRYLYYEKNWGRFSNEKTKLFVPSTDIKEIPVHEAANGLEASETGDEEIRNEDNPLVKKYPSLIPEELICYVAEYEEQEDKEEIVEDENDVNFIESFASKLTDEQTKAILNYLIATKDLGDIETTHAKRTAIRQINNILAPWAVKGL
jgi:hypothetical protein